ncbi:hypothetical protein Q31b_54030 [Novipirellula aureliae]|uniref:Squalene cyclase C-terminal domain-containing protein n=2 Tax=Novipirellula aureliae TaxID=2527966 RepID=A0A5C6DHJ6_9BACT|nr:hypothetical protein Q31b_54030 [Novipirellula aureliae]
MVYAVATVAAALLLATIWLFRRRKKQGRQAGLICLLIAIVLHVALVFCIPLLPKPRGGSHTADPEATEMVGIDEVAFSTFDPEMDDQANSAANDQADIAPLPLSEISDSLVSEIEEMAEPVAEPIAEPVDGSVAENESELLIPSVIPGQLDTPIEPLAAEEIEDMFKSLDADFAKLAQLGTPTPAIKSQTVSARSEQATPSPNPPESVPPSPQSPVPPSTVPPSTVPPSTVTASSIPAPATIAGEVENDFANRVGDAKTRALMQTGGSVQTEAAVAAALKYLASTQRRDGAWDPVSTGAGEERQTLGMNRFGAGSKADTAITGLALLSFMGSGQTHQNGEYANNIYKGLVFLINQQKADGSLAGDAAIYASTYSHGMASLAMAEAAAITQDPSAIESARRAIHYSRRMQHPTTGGWRYTPHDKGDLSQLGWQAMVLVAGDRAGIPASRESMRGVERFLRSVRKGRYGGLASYRPGEATSVTMTAEALATRLLMGEKVRPEEIAEAEQSLLRQKPGSGQDNYYYWYYATVALHQLQSDAWTEWNEAMQKRLLETQLPNGQWPTTSVWGGYGGSIYTTSMATLCLESYYRHSVKKEE